MQIDPTVHVTHMAAQAEGFDYEQTATGVWELDLGGTGGAAIDRLTLTGAALLDGTLAITLIDGYAPALGQTIGILSAPLGVVGMFSTIEQPAGMPAGLKFSAVYNPTLVQLAVVSDTTFSADFNEDGAVDGADLILWQGDFALNGDSDADGDGDSDGADFLAWQQKLGGASAFQATVVVPEVATLPLLATAVLTAILSRERKRHVLP
jgi:hypothetical protein